MPKKVAFIIVGWNNRDLLEDCIRSATGQDYSDVSVYYVDNGSKDDSVTYVKQKFPEVIVVEPGTNTGFAKGNNLGIKEALKDPDVGYIALLNSDARLDISWTTELVGFASLKPRAAILQGTTLDYYNHDVIDSTHIYISYNGQGTQGSWRQYYQRELGPRKVFGANAAACLISKAFIEAQPFGAELFDEAMFMYLEDVDLSTRATLMGWDNYLAPNARAYHMGSASSGKNPGFSLYMTFRNNSALLYKNLPLRMLIRMMPSVLRGDLDTVRSLRKMGKSAAAKKVIKGRVIGILRLPLFIGKRHRMTRARTISDEYLWTLMRRGY